MQTVTFHNWTCNVERTKYYDGNIALQLIDAEDGAPVAMATVNLPDAPLEPNHVYIKNWSENEGVLAALVEAGIVRDTGIYMATGIVLANVCELLS